MSKVRIDLWDSFHSRPQPPRADAPPHESDWSGALPGAHGLRHCDRSGAGRDAEEEGAARVHRGGVCGGTAAEVGVGSWLLIFPGKSGSRDGTI